MIIDGKKIASQFYDRARREVGVIVREGKRPPHLAVIMAGTNPASGIYVSIKQKRALECGISFSLFHLPENITEEDLISKINEINANGDIDGLIVQVPLPSHLNEKKILGSVSPEKDVDGLHPLSAGKLLQNEETYLPCTPAGIIELIRSTGAAPEGLHAVVVGRSNIVGKPCAILLLKENCTVTVCHSKTRNLPEVVQSADILVAAIGKAEFIKGSWIKPGAIVIDVGTNRVEDPAAPKGFRQKGDVEFSAAEKNASHITPVPGGVGPMTVAMLLLNTLKAYRRRFS